MTSQTELDDQGIFRREGDYWTIGVGKDLLRLKDSKGLAYLAICSRGRVLKYPRAIWLLSAVPRRRPFITKLAFGMALRKSPLALATPAPRLIDTHSLNTNVASPTLTS